MSQTISVTIPSGLREKIDTLRGDVSRSRFISRALERVFFKGEVKK
jgi:metal-responsive CopG/Arc/MetJ family transcriptional regulator